MLFSGTQHTVQSSRSGLPGDAWYSRYTSFITESEQVLEKHEGGWQSKAYAPRMFTDSSIFTPVKICLNTKGQVT